MIRYVGADLQLFGEDIIVDGLEQRIADLLVEGLKDQGVESVEVNSVEKAESAMP